MVARRSARSTRTKAVNQIRHLGFTAPDDPRQRLHGLTSHQVTDTAAAMRARPVGDPVRYATKTALRVLGRRVQNVDEELAQLDAMIADLVAVTAPELLAIFGVGAHTAALLFGDRRRQP